MKKRVQICLALLCLCVGWVAAQNGKVTGVVISAEDNEPVVGASVLLKGTTQGSMTDLSGSFTILNVPQNAKTLVVSYVGMRTVEVPVKPYQKVIMQPDT